jgi:hypothetical protein
MANRTEKTVRRSTDLKEFLATLSPAARKLVSALRKLIQRTAPDAEESMLWGGISYHHPQIGGRVKGAVCQIGIKGDSVRLDFIHGIRLTDQCGLLRGERRSKRFVLLESIVDVERPGVIALIEEAAALDPTTWE